MHDPLTVRLSIRTLLLTTIGILTMLIAILVGLSVHKSWLELQRIQDLRNGSLFSNILYEASKHLSLERGASMAVTRVDPDTAKDLAMKITESRKAAERNIDRALGRMTPGEKALHATALENINQRRQALSEQRELLDRELATPQINHPGLPDQLFQTLTFLIMDLQTLNEFYSRPLLIVHPTVTQHIRFKFFVWDITEFAGREYAMIGKLIAEHAPVTPEIQEQLLLWRGRIEQSWEVAREYAQRSGLPEEILPYLEEAETHYFFTFEQIKDIFYAPAALAPGMVYPVDIDVWLELATQAIESLLALKDAVLRETQIYINQLEKEAKKAIAVDLSLFIFTLFLSLYAWHIVIARVIRPVNTMIDALYEASQIKISQEVKISRSQDEIGKLALILEAVQENVRRIEQNSRELKEQRNYLRTVLETVPDGLLTVDGEGRVQLANSAAIALLGYTGKELEDIKISNLVPTDKIRAPGSDFMSFFHSLGKGEDLIICRKDQTCFPTELRINRVEGGGTPIYVILLRDITEQKRAEAEREQYLRDLETSNRELNDFAYIASHDLKEPLRGLHNFSQFLLEDYSDKLDKQGVEMLETIAKLTQRMEGFLSALLHYSRIGRTELSIQETDLNAVVKDALDMHAIAIEEKKAQVKILQKLPTMISDKIRVTEVFQNLIGNALKYNDKKIKIDVGYTRDHPRHPGEYVFFVRDNGIGISDRHLETVFKIFKRLHARDAYGGGTGSGLTIAKKIIDQHHGDIWAESKGKDKGTTFFFTLGPPTANLLPPPVKREPPAPNEKPPGA